MRWLVLMLGLGLLVTGLLLQRQEAPDSELARLGASDETLRRTDAGPVRGGLTGAGTQAWLGIPYAAPPRGILRWRAPQPPRPWRQPRDALRYGAPCPQFASPLEPGDADPGTLIGDEDCLTLNVFAPAGAAERSGLPVMVFIHGGGNSIGSARPYDASRLSQEQGVVVVTLNYRLGILGWFSHPALRATAPTPREASGNFALLDLLAALRWVQGNIAAFGGDHDRVTVFGESAGARNIYGLMASPLARGLFHGAIVQSGRAGSFGLARAENAADDPQPGHPFSSRELLLSWLADTGEGPGPEVTLAQLDAQAILDFMRGLPLDRLMAPVASPAGMYRTPALFRDGVVLPAEPLLEVFADPERWNRVPVLAGSNRDEIKLFLALDERLVRRRLGLLPAPREPERYDRLARLHNLGWRAMGVDEPLAAMARGDPTLPLFAYRFDWDDMRSNWLVDLPQLLGAGHALELDFLFGPLIAREVPGVLHDGNRESYRRLARTLRDYWAGFAYTGRPGSGRSATQRAWPRWSPEQSLTMLLDEPGDGGVHVAPVSVRVGDVKAALGAESELGVRTRCALYVDLFLDNQGLPELYDAQEYQRLGCGPFPAWSLAGEGR
jgi:para-nitrobenzyl esterase